MNRVDDFSYLKKGDHIHFMGIGGTAMGALAGLCQSLGFKITGSDTKLYPPMSDFLASLNIDIYEDFKRENLDIAPDLVVVGNVIRKTYDEAQALLESEIPYSSFPEFLGNWLMKGRDNLVVAGTHGKTTTSSLLSWVAEGLGKKPGFLIGGIPVNLKKSFQAPESDTFVIEGDEYDTAFFDKGPKFLHYHPRSVIWTSFEFDHADIYNDLSHIESSFKKLLDVISDGGNLVYCADEANINRVLSENSDLIKDLNSIGYGIESGDYQIKVVTENSEGTRFKISGPEGLELEGSSLMIGPHNHLNICGVIALAHKLGWDMDLVLKAVAEFKGVMRRLQLVKNKSKTLFFEDFAHHPTAVRKTLTGVRAAYPKSNIIAIFEPRSATARSNHFQKEFMEALSLADQVLLARPKARHESETNLMNVAEVIDGLVQSKTKAQVVEDGLEAFDVLSQLNFDNENLVVVMSNGGFEGLVQKIEKL